MITTYFAHFQGKRSHYFLIPEELIEQRMKEIVSDLKQYETSLDIIKVSSTTRIKVTAYADVTEAEFRYAFRKHPKFLRQFELFPLHDDTFTHLDDPNILFILEVQYPKARPFLQVFSTEKIEDHARSNTLSMRIERKDKGTPQINFDRSLKVRYKDYEVLNEKEANRLFGSYFRPPMHGL